MTIHSKTPVLESLFDKVAGAFRKEKKVTPAQVLFFEYCKIFKNDFFIEHLWWLLLKLEIFWMCNSFIHSLRSPQPFPTIDICNY